MTHFVSVQIRVNTRDHPRVRTCTADLQARCPVSLEALAFASAEPGGKAVK